MTTTTVHMRWVDVLPPQGDRSQDVFPHQVIAETLRSRPGVWAMLPDVPVAYTRPINVGRNTAYRPAGSFEAVSRRGVLYARYIGPAATS